MFQLLLGISARIASNSLLNVFQKILSSDGIKSSVINFYTYLGLTFLCFFIIPFAQITYSQELLINFVFMGILGALGNYFIIKALSIGELSALAPINAYKPIVALVFAFFYLKEVPNIAAGIGIALIITGTYFLYAKTACFNKQAILYRVLALIFSGTEAVYIKKIIMLTNVPFSFILWSISGLIFSSFLIFKRSNELSKMFKFSRIQNLFYLVSCVGIMQYSTNFVFSKMNVSYALALFQLSTILSVLLGANIFREKNIKRKILASIIMIIGAIIIILKH